MLLIFSSLMTFLSCCILLHCSLFLGACYSSTRFPSTQNVSSYKATLVVSAYCDINQRSKKFCRLAMFRNETENKKNWKVSRENLKPFSAAIWSRWLEARGLGYLLVHDKHSKPRTKHSECSKRSWKDCLLTSFALCFYGCQTFWIDVRVL